MSGNEARASYMVDKCSTTELHPQPLTEGFLLGALSYFPSILKHSDKSSPAEIQALASLRGFLNL